MDISDPAAAAAVAEQMRRGVEDMRRGELHVVQERKPEGLKLDKGKLEWSLFPVDALREVSRVLMWGAYEVPRPDGKKGYGPGNWEYVQDARRRYYDAALRHLTTWYEGEVFDPDSGRHHLGHAICCACFLLALELRGKLK